jgi:hypothetical protein
MSFVREHFPHLAADYNRRYATADFVDAAYRREVSARVRAACRRYGLPQRSTDALLTRATGALAAHAAAAPVNGARKAPQPVRAAGFPRKENTAQGLLFAAS